MDAITLKMKNNKKKILLLMTNNLHEHESESNYRNVVYIKHRSNSDK